MNAVVYATLKGQQTLEPTAKRSKYTQSKPVASRIFDRLGAYGIAGLFATKKQITLKLIKFNGNINKHYIKTIKNSKVKV